MNRLQINFDFVMGSDFPPHVSDHQHHDGSELSANSVTDYFAITFGLHF